MWMSFITLKGIFPMSPEDNKELCKKACSYEAV